MIILKYTVYNKTVNIESSASCSHAGLTSTVCSTLHANHV